MDTLRTYIHTVQAVVRSTLVRRTVMSPKRDWYVLLSVVVCVGVVGIVVGVFLLSVVKVVGAGEALLALLVEGESLVADFVEPNFAGARVGTGVERLTVLLLILRLVAPKDENRGLDTGVG